MVDDVFGQHPALPPEPIADCAYCALEAFDDHEKHDRSVEHHSRLAGRKHQDIVPGQPAQARLDFWLPAPKEMRNAGLHEALAHSHANALVESTEALAPAVFSLLTASQQGRSQQCCHSPAGLETETRSTAFFVPAATVAYAESMFIPFFANFSAASASAPGLLLSSNCSSVPSV